MSNATKYLVYDERFTKEPECSYLLAAAPTLEEARLAAEDLNVIVVIVDSDTDKEWRIVPPGRSDDEPTREG